MREEDRSAAQMIAVRAFDKNALDWYNPVRSLVGETPDGTITCCLETYPAPVYFGTASVPACSIGGVATDPAAQRQGYAGGLVVGAIHQMRDNGHAICPLWPFSFAYYRKFGWELTCPDTEITIQPAAVRALLSPASGFVRAATADDLPAVCRVYATHAQQYNCQTVRPESWWAERAGGVFPEQTFVCTDESGAVTGYALTRKSTQPQTYSSTVRVVELCGLDFASESALVNTLASLPEVTELVLVLPARTAWFVAFADRVPIRQPYRLQTRVLDIRLALESLRPPEHLQGTLGFSVSDPIVCGEHPIEVVATVEAGQVAVSNQSHPDAIRCGIEHFSQLFCGGVHIAWMRTLNRVQGGNVATDTLCDQLFSGRVPFRSELETG